LITKRFPALLIVTLLMAALPEAALSAQERGFGAESKAWWSFNEPARHFWFGLAAGYTHNTLDQAEVATLRPYRQERQGHGWTASVPVRFVILNWLSVQAEAEFISKNYGWQNLAYNNSSGINNYFFNVPITARLAWLIPGTGRAHGNGLEVYAAGGFWLGVWFLTERYGREDVMGGGSYMDYPYRGESTAAFHERKAPDKSDYNILDAGLIAAGGIQYTFKKFACFAEFRYHFPLQDMLIKATALPLTQKNQAWTLRAGIMFTPAFFRKGRSN
jgi:hypothetical protein